MLVKQVILSNFRNYTKLNLELKPGKTILIGDNAQGKSNFLESLEIVSLGKSSRASQDSELIFWGQKSMSCSIVYEREGAEQTLSLELRQPGKAGAKALEKELKINGVIQSSLKALTGRLPAVIFTSADLNLLRGGPKYRREWIDGVILRLRPAYQEVLSSYGRVITQRNRLLKALFEKGKLTVADQDQLLAWDRQLARFGAQIIRQRVRLLHELLPIASQRQEHLSGNQETLQADYLFKASDSQDEEPEDSTNPPPRLSLSRLIEAEEQEISDVLLKLLKERRSEEIGRRQSVIGPHRDDICFCLNQVDAVSFASQGQQRSLVLGLKLAELERISQALNEPPVLLLDDVLAELDVSRQGQLMSAVAPNMQTIITTTHLSRFDPQWLVGAALLSISSGQVSSVALPESA